jgi:prepilin peptidase CpaA
VIPWLPSLHLALLLVFLGIAAWTDLRSRTIYNWTTFSGMAVALVLASLSSLSGGEEVDGPPTLLDSLYGFLACAVLMIVCYCYYGYFGGGGIGAGDVKLIAMMGTFLGLYPGMEAMLWTLVLGACVGMIQMIWAFGALELVRRMFAGLRSAVANGGFVLVADDERERHQTDIFLGPCALVGAAIVRFGLFTW